MRGFFFAKSARIRPLIVRVQYDSEVLGGRGHRGDNITQQSKRAALYEPPGIVRLDLPV